ncbi:MAG: hypothetical protein A2451_07655 [Bdellovibrionales bacterium RIFOXYC2_FULL_39_8]|nr:MAG: hypothetical protein A2451_07655 [Bdellovibrionales bacterium RIFOXYC2_FULL_39_8]
MTIESLPPPMSVILTESNVGTEVFAKEDAGITGEVDIGIDTFDEEEAQTVADEILDQYNNTIPEFSPVSMVEFKIIVQ